MVCPDRSSPCEIAINHGNFNLRYNFEFWLNKQWEVIHLQALPKYISTEPKVMSQ